MDAEAVIIRGSLERLTPILMTALTAALTLIPLAMAWATRAPRSRRRRTGSFSAL
jgi:Cu/Ag efflux pump CusA